MKTIYYDGDIITMTVAKDSCEARVAEDKKLYQHGFPHSKTRRWRFTEMRHRSGI
ncbi:MAG: hypothetical protein ACLTH3_15410 [Lachnospira sp.]